MSLVERAMAKYQAEITESAATAPHIARVNVTDAEPGRMLSLDLPAIQARGFLPGDTDNRQIADQYRRIKRPILDRVRTLLAASAPGAQLVMMASALPGDGKTFSALNLALSMARERDISVLLVDADVAKPHISRMLGIDKEPGLVDVLAEESLDVESLVLGTDIPRLAILPAGRLQSIATELLSSLRMAEVVGRLTKSNPTRVVLFDTAPLLLSSESRAVSQVAGQVVMVVRAGSTPEGAVLDAIGHIPADKLTGLVLNQSDMSSAGMSYGYGAYGDYGDASAE